MEYKISVPIINKNVSRMGRDALAKCLMELDAKRVMLALDCYELDIEKRKKTIEELNKNCEYYHSLGFEVGAWIWAFMFKEAHPFTSMTAFNNLIADEFACPLDRKFLEFSGDYIRDVASTGVDVILFDDDFRFGFLSHGNMCCLCDHHMDMISKKLGERMTREALIEKILSGEKNKYRDAWLEVNGYALEGFAANARKYVDSVDPKIRMGYCACMTGWDIDGTDPDRLCRIFAGNTKPFLRLIGAPYWASKNPGNWGNRLQHVIELERMESSWIKDKDIEILAEGDAYPRPRIQTPASYLEGFDTAIRASGATDGILKYAIDYTSSPKYERGYIDYHKRNRQKYDQIDDMFSNKTACGVRVYESARKVANADLSEYQDPIKCAQYLFFSSAARFLSVQAIPTTYEGNGCFGIAFGENVKYLTPDIRKNGLIIDGSAARSLHKMGVDVGIEEIGERVRSVTERFVSDGELINTYSATVFNNSFKKDINILSFAQQNGGEALMGKNEGVSPIPLSYLYENADGERYFVINVDAGNCGTFDGKPDILCHQARGRQIADISEWLSGGKALPAYCYGNPYLYMIAKESDGKLTVGLWNFFADPIFEPIVELAESYSSIKVLDGNVGELSEKTVRLGEIPAFGFAAFELTK